MTSVYESFRLILHWDQLAEEFHNNKRTSNDPNVNSDRRLDVNGHFEMHNMKIITHHCFDCFSKAEWRVNCSNESVPDRCTSIPDQSFNSQLLSSFILLQTFFPNVTASTSFNCQFSNSRISVFTHGWLSRNKWIFGRIYTAKRLKWDLGWCIEAVFWKLIGMWFVLIVKESSELTSWRWWTWQ